jgi:hypothetical protein
VHLLLFESILRVVGFDFESVISPNFMKYSLPIFVQVTNSYLTE